VKRLAPSIDRSLPAQGWQARARVAFATVAQGRSSDEQTIGGQTMNAGHPGKKEERGA